MSPIRSAPIRRRDSSAARGCRIAGRGIGAPNAGPGGAAYAGIAYEVTTEAESRKAVQELAARKVDLVKIWVDDRNGRAPRLASNLFRAIIDEGHKHGLRVNAHVFYYTDAVDLVDAGIDGFAHLVRDKEMDDRAGRGDRQAATSTSCPISVPSGPPMRSCRIGCATAIR